MNLQFYLMETYSLVDFMYLKPIGQEHVLTLSCLVFVPSKVHFTLTFLGINLSKHKCRNHPGHPRIRNSNFTRYLKERDLK